LTQIPLLSFSGRPENAENRVIPSARIAVFIRNPVTSQRCLQALDSQPVSQPVMHIPKILLVFAMIFGGGQRTVMLSGTILSGKQIYTSIIAVKQSTMMNFIVNFSRNVVERYCNVEGILTCDKYVVKKWAEK
jgi:hypothetical protein